MTYLKMVFLGIGLLFTFNASGQDPHFSQFNASPFVLNPALTGAINGESRIIANYRNQWRQLLNRDSYQTYALSYDRRMNLKSGDYIGLGASYTGDVAGAIRFGTVQVNLNFSYAKKLLKTSSASHSIIGGFQVGMAQRKINTNNLIWPSQTTQFEPSGFISNPDFLFSDFSTGLLWVSNFGERKNFYAGISVFHLNRPNVSFQVNSIVRMSMRTSIHLGSELPLSSRLSVLPNLMYQRQGIHNQLNIGTKLSISKLSSSFISNIQGGISYRAGQDAAGRIHSDAIIGLLSLQLKGFQLGFSYDFTISKLNVNNVGAMEFTVGYLFKKSNKEVTPFDVPQF